MRDRAFAISGLGIDSRHARGSVRHVRQRVRYGVRHQHIDFEGCAACAAYAYVMRARTHVRSHVRAHARACMPHMAHMAHKRIVMPFVGARRGAHHAAQRAGIARG